MLALMHTRLLLSTCLVTALACAAPGDAPAPAFADPALADPAPTHPELAAQILELAERDQVARGAMIEAFAEATPAEDGSLDVAPSQLGLVLAVQAIDAESTAFLRGLVADTGWPTYDQVGAKAADSAWLLVQHADAAPELQAEVLALMEPLVEAGQASGLNLAYLSDRVRCAAKQPQSFGTQFGSDASGVHRPFPLEDPAGIDERRASVGLEPLAEYARQISEVYGAEASPEPLEAFP